MTQTPTRQPTRTPTLHRIGLAADEALERAGQVQAVRYDQASRGIVLHDRRLIEDDGPGIRGDAGWQRAGRAPLQLVAGPRCLRKLLHIDEPAAISAHLVARGRRQNSGGESAVGRIAGAGMSIHVNGVRIDPTGEVPVDALKAGDNEVLITCPPDRPHLVKYARREEIIEDEPQRADRPPRSFRSLDGRRTWEAIDGELMVRLHLVQHEPVGEIVSPVLEPATDGLRRAASITAIELEADADTPASTSIDWAVRTGSTPLHEPASWSDWQPPGAVSAAGHAFFQWRATLRSADGRRSPALRQVTATVELDEAEAPAWAAGLRVVAAHNADMRYSAVPFACEAMRHERLQALREKYRLDDVVATAGSELERLVRLRHWVANQWSWDPPADHYPAWDAHEILAARKGFCVQFAIVYLQACLSMGHPARFVFGYHPGPDGGHEVVEVWSGQFDKWVLMDPNVNEHYIDPATGTPLSMLEVHERLIRRYYPAGRQINEANRPAAMGIEDIATCQRLDLEPTDRQGLDLSPAKWPRWAKWAVIRMVPRNDFYGRAHPLPRQQGANWDWPHYLVWEGEQARPSEAYRYWRITRRRADWHWTLNRVRYDALPGDEPATVTLRLATVTPGFEAFEVREDDGPWRDAGELVTWRLSPGRNRLEMRVRNVLGVTGAASALELTYEG